MNMLTGAGMSRVASRLRDWLLKIKFSEIHGSRGFDLGLYAER